MKPGDKVWVLCEVEDLDFEGSTVGYRGYRFFAYSKDCKPVEPDPVIKEYLKTESGRLNTVTFDIGDPVMSYDGRKGIVEAINLIKDFPITVRYSMREQVSYKFSDVKHDDDPMGKEDVKQSLRTESDPTNPSHYKQGGIECIEAIKAATGDGFVGYVWGNVLKYLWRWPKKGGVDDLKKARWYLDRLIKEVGE